MEVNRQQAPMLELLLRPAFCVVAGRITKINQAAAPYLLQEGVEVIPMLASGKEEYAAFTDGCLYLTLTIGNQKLGANVLALEDCHLFVLEQANEKTELLSLALAAKELREPLSGMATSASQILSQSEADQKYMAQFNRRLYQMMRIVSNMSDAFRYSRETASILASAERKS